MIAQHRNQLAPIKSTLGIVKQPIPIVPFRAAIHQVARHDIKRRIRSISKGVMHQSPPAIQSVLRVAHVNKRKRFHASRRRGEFRRLRPPLLASVAHGINVGGARLQPAQDSGVPIDRRVIHDGDRVESKGFRFHPQWPPRAKAIKRLLFLISDHSLARLGARPPLDGLSRFRIRTPSQYDLVRLFGTRMCSPAEHFSESRVLLAVGIGGQASTCPSSSGGIVVIPSSRSM